MRECRQKHTAATNDKLQVLAKRNISLNNKLQNQSQDKKTDNFVEFVSTDWGWRIWEWHREWQTNTVYIFTHSPTSPVKLQFKCYPKYLFPSEPAPGDFGE